MQISTIISLALFCGSVYATYCPPNSLCVWKDANFMGERTAWSGDDELWESEIADEDSSWANKVITGQGIKDHVKIYDAKGAITICLTPGQEVASNSVANNRGHSHKWDDSCDGE